MKNFKELLASDELVEGLTKTAAVMASARKSKAAGDKAVRAYERAIGRLKRGQASNEVPDTLRHLKSALESSLQGQIATRDQIGNLVAAVVAAQMIKPRR